MSYCINDLKSQFMPVMEVIPPFCIGFRAIVAVHDVFTPLTAISIGTRTAMCIQIPLHISDAIQSGKHTYKQIKKQKERLLSICETVALSTVLVEDMGLLVMGFEKVGLVSLKAATIAGYVCFGAMVVEAALIAIDGYRIHQLRKESKRVAKSPLEELNFTENISYKALYNVKKSAFEYVEKTEAFRAHLQKRLTTGKIVRSIAIVASLMAIIGVGILCFTPAAPVGWTFIAVCAVVSIALIVIKKVAYDRLNRELEDIKTEQRTSILRGEKVKLL